jgi:U4/U6.U5 tri-snRNP component SNU23
MSSEKVGAYGNKASEASFRRKWDKEEYAAKAAAQDAEHAEQSKAAQEALAKGKKPRYRKDDLPKPTKALEARTADLDIDKNLNKTVLVSNVGGKGAGQPGFYVSTVRRHGPRGGLLPSPSSLCSPCTRLTNPIFPVQCELCHRTLKDSIAYLDHVNGRSRE